MLGRSDSKEGRDDGPQPSPVVLSAADEMKVVASNLPERTLSLLQTLGTPFVVAPALSKAPSSPGHVRVPQHLHHHLASSESKEQTGMMRAASPPPRQHYYGPLCSGWLWLQKTAGKWKRVWCEYSDGHITYRDDETARKPKGTVQVTFIEAELNPYKPTAPPTRQSSYGQTPQQQQQQQQQHYMDDGHVLPTSPQLTTSISSPLAQPSATRPQLSINTAAAPTASQQSAAMHDAEALNETLSRLALSPPPPALVPSMSASPPSPSHGGASSKFSELYYAYLESLEQPFTFKVYAPARVYYFRADVAEVRSTFVSTIRSQLLSSSLDNNPLFSKKALASLSLSACLHEQFMLQLHRYNLLVKALAKMTMEDELPITSTRKEKSGVLCMETTQEGSVRWRDYYFVLFEGALFYYKDSKSTTPTGFITLRYATVTIDVSKMIRNDFVFHVITPLRTIACRTKHAVALAEWITALESTLAAHNNRAKEGRAAAGGSAAGVGGGASFRQERIPSFGGMGLGERQVSGGGGAAATLGGALSSGLGERERSMSDNGFDASRGSGGSAASGAADGLREGKGKSVSVLQSIHKFIAEVQSFNSLIGHPAGLDAFRKFLSDERDRKSAVGLEFYLATNDFINTPASAALPASSSSSSSSSFPPAAVAPSAADLLPAAESIQSRFFTKDSPDSLLPFLPSSLTAPLFAPLSLSSTSPAVSITMFDPLRKALASVLTADYHAFKSTADYDTLSSLLSSSSAADQRTVEPFDVSSAQLFLLKVKGTKRSKEIKFNKKEALWTIGRDKSNKLVIEDSRVSRSHARVEYSDSACEYIDLGSSCVPEHDTRVLTDSGFLFLSDIERRISAGERVLYACYDTSTESIVYSPGKLKYAAPPTRWVDFTHAGTQRLWDATSDAYGATVAANGVEANRLTLRTTPDHDMYVQLCTRCGDDSNEVYEPRIAGGAPIPPHKQIARELAPGYQCGCAAGDKCTHGYSHYRMYTGAAAGLRAPANVISLTDRDPLSPVAALGLRTTDELDAFLELFGMWLGDGSMTYGGNAVTFSQRKDRDEVYLRGLIQRLGLIERLEWRYEWYEKSRTHAFRITASRWFEYFDTVLQYGIKYKNSRHYNERLALLKQGMHSSQRRPRMPALSTPASTTRSLRESSSASCASPPCSPSSSSRRFSIDLTSSSTTSFTFTPRGRSTSAASTDSFTDAIAIAVMTSPEPRCLLCGGVEYLCGDKLPGVWHCSTCIARLQDEAAELEGEWVDKEEEVKSPGSVCDAAMEADGAAVKDEEPPIDDGDTPMKDEESQPPLEAPTPPPPADVPSEPEEDDDHPDEKEPPTDDEDDPVRSAKWLPAWALFRLDARQLRLVIEGLRQADGYSAASAEQLQRAATGGSELHDLHQICTSGLGFRDQLVHACLHAGYSAYFKLNTRAGEVRGYHAVPGDRHIYTPKEMEAALRVDSTRQFKPVRGKHDNWWVCYQDVVSALLPAEDVRFDGSPSRIRQKTAYKQGWVAQHTVDGTVQQAESQSKMAALLSREQSVICRAYKKGYRVDGVWRILTAAQYEEQRSGQAASLPAAADIPTQAADRCVEVEHPNHLIFVQRAHCNDKGVVTKVGRPVLVGNCGSKLNGKPVLRARLKAGDVIELGQSTLIFQVKPKKRFRLFGGGE